MCTGLYASVIRPSALHSKVATFLAKNIRTYLLTYLLMLLLGGQVLFMVAHVYDNVFNFVHL